LKLCEGTVKFQYGLYPPLFAVVKMDLSLMKARHFLHKGQPQPTALKAVFPR